MNFELGQKVKETKVMWECKTGVCEPFEVEEEWVVTDILFDGDIVLGECNGMKKYYIKENHMLLDVTIQHIL